MIQRIKEINDYMAHFSTADIERVYSYTVELAQINTYPSDRPNCPYCEGQHVIKWGFKGGKQRFLCKECKDTFMHTTNTVMSHSHYDRTVWREAIADTLAGRSLDETAERLGFSHQTAFTMRHKILLALSEVSESSQDKLSEVSELDETYVLDCYKGRRVPESAGRKARTHGATALKRGISSEQVCICTGVQRHGYAMARTANRAKPSIEELKAVFGGRIGRGALLLVDGLRGYASLEETADCSVKNILTEVNSAMYNLNSVNNFHSFIKDRYNYYRGVATKYLNRYNVLFGCAYRNIRESISHAFTVLCNTSSINRWKTARDVVSEALLAI